MAEELETIILRFRDLTVGSTISEHSAIIEEHGYVWWAWWAKPYETIPFASFKELNDIAKGSEDGLTLYLFNSGDLLLYEAKCSQIEYSTSADRIESPEDTKTPGYYASASYVAWFKLAEISDPISGSDAKEIVQRFSYYEEDNVIVDHEHNFAVFNNKRVCSLDELEGQSRTIWFLRSYKTGDRTSEILNYSDPKKTAVDKQFRRLATNTLLWLSDLHFSPDHHNFNHKDYERSLSLFSVVNAALSKRGLTPSGVIMSGDITFKAAKEEFSEAVGLVQNLNSAYGLDSGLYSICPGNHDIAFSDDPGFGENIAVAFPEAKKNYVDFYQQVCGQDATEELFSIKRFLTHDYRPVEIISLNSNYLQQKAEHFQGMGYVGPDQLRKIEDELGSPSETMPLRILLLHHHLMPVVYRETPAPDTMYSVTLDSEAVVQFVVRNRIPVVLHGHAHKDFYARVVRKYGDSCELEHEYHVVGLGSSGVAAEHLTEGKPNMFATLEIDRENMRIRGFELCPTGKEGKELFCHYLDV